MRSKIIHGVVWLAPVWIIAGDNFVVDNGASQLEDAETKVLVDLQQAIDQVALGTVTQSIKMHTQTHAKDALIYAWVNQRDEVDMKKSDHLSENVPIKWGLWSSA